jgi:hypothetical protein
VINYNYPVNCLWICGGGGLLIFNGKLDSIGVIAGCWLFIALTSLLSNTEETHVSLICVFVHSSRASNVCVCVKGLRGNELCLTN